jgi:multidrug efflux pump subunit AcrA (membrane-fusion protein)
MICTLVSPPGCGDEPGGAKGGGQKPQEPVAVAVMPARTDSVQRSVEIVGTLYGQEDASISNKVPGRVTNIFKDIGDRVAPGEPLAQLLTNDYQLSLNEKKAQLGEALASLGVSDVPAENFDVENVPAVKRAKLQADNAKAKFERGRQLFEDKPPRMSEQEFGDLRTEAQVAQSAYEAARLDARTLVSTARTRQSQVAIAEQALRDTTIRAPRPWRPDGSGPLDDAPPPGPETPTAAGAATQPVADASGSSSAPVASDADKPYVVAARYSNEGELNAGLTRMFRLVIDDPLKLRASVPERHAGRIKVGQRVTLGIEAETKTFPGTVARINPQIDPTNRMFEVEVSVANPEHLLKPGAFARGHVETAVQPNVLLVPERAVVSFAGVKKVFTAKDGKAVEVPVETGARVGDWVEVTKAKDLKPGDAVVVDGANRLAAGVPVTVRPAASK